MAGRDLLAIQHLVAEQYDLALKIERITSDRKKIVEFGNNSFRLANKLYSIDAQKEALAKFLN